VFRRIVSAHWAGIVVVCVASRAWADEPTLAEVEYDPEQRPPVTTPGQVRFVGAVLTGGWYGVALGTSLLWKDAPNARRLRLPLVGPFAALGDIGCGEDEPRCSTVSVVLRTGLAVISGVGQAGGVLAVVESFFLPTQVAPSVNERAHVPQDEPRWVLTPQPLVTDSGAVGLGVGGRF
jgi:hypothetical protein